MIAAFRWAVGNWRIVAGLAGMLAILWSVVAIRSALIEQGREQCRVEVEKAIALQQAIADQASLDYETGRAARRADTQEKAREVIRYVEVDSDCDWSPRAFRVLNDAITGADAPGELGGTVSGSTDYGITKPTGDGSLDSDGGGDVQGLPSQTQRNRGSSDR